MPDLNCTPRAGDLVDRRREKLGDYSRGGDDLNMSNNRGGICHSVNYFFAERLKVLASRRSSYRLHLGEAKQAMPWHVVTFNVAAIRRRRRHKKQVQLSYACRGVFLLSGTFAGVSTALANGACS
jgi:hypothetical protein